MSFKLLELLEPEESVGQLWHRLITRGTGRPVYPQAVAKLAPLQKRLLVFFHGLGGNPGVEFKAISSQTSEHRMRWRERFANVEGEIQQARFDGERLFLPAQLDGLSTYELNEGLYFWLTAFCASAKDEHPGEYSDPLQKDIATLRFALQNAARTLAHYPGLAKSYRLLQKSVLNERPERPLPPIELALESVLQTLLGGHELADVDKALASNIKAAVNDVSLPLDNFKAPSGYRPMMPVMLWGEFQPFAARQKSARGDDERPLAGAPPEEEATDKTIRAKRDKADQAERKDSLILYPFSGLLSWMEMLNINRKIEDEDEDAARKVMDEVEEISLANVSKRTATKLKFDLDLAPEDVEREKLSGRHLYPEWDYRTSSFLPDQCHVLTQTAPEAEPGREWRPTSASNKRIRAVRRRFEALRPKREMLHGQLDGGEFDMEALIRSRCDLAASGQGSDRIFIQSRPQARDLSIAVLIDTSRSTESWIEGRQVIEIAREALAALALGLKASGDDFALYSFSSVRRDRVYVSTLKRFDETVNETTLSRIGALRPGFYTRMGTAIRHVGGELAKQPSERRLLLVITDGKPNDLDHYEGRYGLEDTRHAILEARRKGLAVFGVTIDAKAQEYFPYMFGRGAYSIVSHPDRLTKALPVLFQHLVA